MTTMLRELKRRIHTRCVKSLMILYTMKELQCSDRARNHPRFSKWLAPCYRAVWHKLARQTTTRSKMEDRPGLCPHQKRANCGGSRSHALYTTGRMQARAKGLWLTSQLGAQANLRKPACLCSASKTTPQRTALLRTQTIAKCCSAKMHPNSVPCPWPRSRLSS